MRVHPIPSRPHVQGSAAPLRLRHSGGDPTDGAGLLLLRRLWDRLGLGQRIDAEGSKSAGPPCPCRIRDHHDSQERRSMRKYNVGVTVSTRTVELVIPPIKA